MNIVFIVIDALRADHLGVSGYGRDTSPNIDKLAKESIFFSNAITTIPSTTPAVASMMTGLHPHSHGLRFIHRQKLDQKLTTLAETLKAHGYKTIGYDIDSIGDGIDKGFDSFTSLNWRIINKIRRTIKKSVDWSYKANKGEELSFFIRNQLIKNKNKKFFLYAHYDDLHHPYNPPSPFDNMFDKSYTGNHAFNDFKKIRRGDLIFNNKLPKEEIHHAIAHYDGMIRFIDIQIGKVIGYLYELNLMNNTIIILCSDHGESLGEHNLFFQHTMSLYEETLRIPLIMKIPGMAQKRIQSQAQSIDIMPTLLEILDIPVLDKIDGKSLAPMIKGRGDDRKFLFAENGELIFKQNNRSFLPGIEGKWRAIRTNEWKLICIPHPKNNIYELYNLKNDPKESVNLIDKEPKIFNALKEELLKWIESSKHDTDIDLTEKSKKLLKELGYIE